MKELLKAFIKKISPTMVVHWKAYKSLILNRESYLYSTGWLQSIDKGRPSDAEGNPIPWMNFPIIKLLEERLKSDQNIFEYGSGYSTRFYAGKVKAVTSLEYDEDWYKLINSDIPKNVQLIYKEKDVDGEYCRVISATKELYDVVIIDGRDRVNCVKQAIPTLSLKGVILLDDSQRERYKEGINFAKNLGFRVLNIEGIKATGTGLERSTILYRTDNCFDI